MSVIAAVTAELASLPDALAESTLAATAIVLAEQLDGDSSATSKSMVSKELRETMAALRSLAPAKPEEDEVERARKRRADRLARQSAAGAAPSS